MKPLVAVTVILSLSAVASNRAFDDWPQWRGLKRDGISAERGQPPEVMLVAAAINHGRQPNSPPDVQCTHAFWPIHFVRGS